MKGGLYGKERPVHIMIRYGQQKRTRSVVMKPKNNKNYGSIFQRRREKVDGWILKGKKENRLIVLRDNSLLSFVVSQADAFFVFLREEK